MPTDSEIENLANKNSLRNSRLRSNIRSWSLVAGALIIVAACILSYMLTQPAEADVAILNILLVVIAITNV